MGPLTGPLSEPRPRRVQELAEPYRASEERQGPRRLEFSQKERGDLTGQPPDKQRKVR